MFHLLCNTVVVIKNVFFQIITYIQVDTQKLVILASINDLKIFIIQIYPHECWIPFEVQLEYNLHNYKKTPSERLKERVSKTTSNISDKKIRYLTYSWIKCHSTSVFNCISFIILVECEFSAVADTLNKIEPTENTNHGDLCMLLADKAEYYNTPGSLFALNIIHVFLF